MTQLATVLTTPTASLTDAIITYCATAHRPYEYVVAHLTVAQKERIRKEVAQRTTHVRQNARRSRPRGDLERTEARFYWREVRRRGYQPNLPAR